MLNFFRTFAVEMKLSAVILHLLKRKAATAVLITASVAAFAALGDGPGKKNTHRESFLSSKTSTYNYKSFSLKSGYNYRGNTVFCASLANRYITLNTVVTYQIGNNTYILPLKKKVLLDKINLNPAGRPGLGISLYK